MGRSGNLMVIKALKWQALHGSLAKRLALRTLMLAVAISMLLLMHVVCDFGPNSPFFMSYDGCDADADEGYFGKDTLIGRVLKPVTLNLRTGICKDEVNVTISVVDELVSKKLLNFGAKSLCIGQASASASTMSALREMGFLDVDVVHKQPFFALRQKRLLCDLAFGDNSFDFVISRDLDKVTVPALLVNEVERILKPGGVAAMLVGVDSSSHDGLIRSATTVSSFLKSSSVVHVVSLGRFTLVAFRKKGMDVSASEMFRLPGNCPVKRPKDLLNNLEPLIEKMPKGNYEKIAYLPSYIDVPSKGKLVYIDMGSKEAANYSGANWFLPSYPIDSRAFTVYIVDHDASVLSSHVKSPGVTFIYHPALAVSAEDKENFIADEEPLLAEEAFDFFVWFKETVELADFVVLKMNMGKPEMKFLSELFASGVICNVDELFLQCPAGENCTEVSKSLRNIGVFAHQISGGT